MTRKIADCRQFPSETHCSLTISGEEEEVVRATAEHEVSVHGETDSPELRRRVRAALRDESDTSAMGPPPPGGEIFDL
ncbi:DUF1059 domain-containing protein [Streptomyces sp. TP-A0874]|uniref:DUF1059 domain-containing protein n=1 Tax=Streptomyces sp. TP-A0874 TaxID=549819 RepID=UPI0008535861|nr:DUF1059 domain-containing protein [Streptomyces sp. TP-A0874]